MYFKLIGQVYPMEVLGHRIVWSVPFLALLIVLERQGHVLREILSDPKVVATLFLTALLVGGNWFIFIYAVLTDRILDASLGYFINPLMNVLLGAVFLKERLRRGQGLAVFLAGIGTLVMTVHQGGLPWISLVLPFSFGFYGLLRKTVPVDSVKGLFIETALLFPVAFIYLVYREMNGVGSFVNVDWQTTLLLSLAGVITSGPLICFTKAARRLRYGTLGLLQYLAPTLQFFLGVFCYDEPFTAAHTITFCFIWGGLGLFTADTFLTLKTQSNPPLKRP